MAIHFLWIITELFRYCPPEHTHIHTISLFWVWSGQKWACSCKTFGGEHAPYLQPPIINPRFPTVDQIRQEGNWKEECICRPQYLTPFRNIYTKIVRLWLHRYFVGGGLTHFLRNLHIFLVPVITFFPFLLCK